MRQLSFYFSGPSGSDERLPYAPTPEHMYADFIQVVYSSGYRLKSSSIKYNKKFVTIDVIGEK